jgi:pimeloyl-ACP methyl ester carboxylesterase
LKFRKGLKITGFIFLGFFIAFIILLYLKRPRTPAIRDPRGNVIPGSIATLEKVNLGGLDQWISIRGEDTSNPILLFLHGGPGMPMMYLAHTFQKHLEDSFICVQWDQRGAGKSYNKHVLPETMTVTQVLSDARALTEILRHRFRKDRITLVGHSWGSYLGMLLVSLHPDLYDAYIGVGQVVDEKKSRDIIDRFIREQANKRGEIKAIQELDSMGSGVHEKWLFAFGGELHNHTSFVPFIKAGIMSPEYGLFEIPKVSRGSQFSSRHMKYNSVEGPILECVTRVDIPVYFFTGRHDYTTPFELVEIYMARLEAPEKKLVWFEDSAHFPFFEEPAKFAAMVKKLILNDR